MGDKQKIKIENAISKIGEKLEDIPKLSESDKRAELKKITVLMDELESDIQRFQMTEYAKYPELCEEFEQKFNELTDNFKKASSTGKTDNELEEEEKRSDDQDATQRQIMETNAKLIEGKNRALAMLHTINNMKAEINLIDDEVMLQREKLLSVNKKLKDTQSILNQSKKLVAFFSKAVYEDLIIKILMGLILIAIIAILIFAFSIKGKKDALIKEQKEQQELDKQSENFDDIKELEFSHAAYHVDNTTSQTSDKKPNLSLRNLKEKRKIGHTK